MFGFWQLLNLVNLANTNPTFVCINKSSGRATFAPLCCLAGNFVWLSLFVFLDLCVCVWRTRAQDATQQLHFVHNLFMFCNLSLGTLDKDTVGGDGFQWGDVDGAPSFSCSVSLSVGRVRVRVAYVRAAYGGLTTAGSAPAASIFIIIKSVERKSIWVT